MSEDEFTYLNKKAKKHPNKLESPNIRSNVEHEPSIGKSHAISKYTRFVTIRLLRELDAPWREAVRLSGLTQTEIFTELMKAFIINVPRQNLEINKKLDALCEEREISTRKAVSASIDDAIANLKRKHQDLE